MAKTQIRLSPSGPDVVGIDGGFIVQSNAAVIPAVTVGTLVGAPREIQADVTSTTQHNRPFLEQVSADSRLRVEVDFDLHVAAGFNTTACTVALEVSGDDGATWSTASTVSWSQPATSTSPALEIDRHVHCESVDIPVTSLLPSFVDGGRVYARATAACAGSTASLALATNYHVTRLTEVLAP